jgi:hypothetical protein
MEMVLFFLTKKNLILKKRVIRIGSINNIIFMPYVLFYKNIKKRIHQGFYTKIEFFVAIIEINTFLLLYFDGKKKT